MPYVWVFAILFVAFRFAVAFRAIERVGREELVDGEVNPGEELAGVFFIGANALFVGQAVVVGWDKQLRIALELDDGELAEGHEDTAFCWVEHQLAREAFRNKVWDFKDTRVCLVMIAYIDEFHSENNRIDSLDDADGEICALDCREIVAMQAGL